MNIGKLFNNIGNKVNTYIKSKQEESIRVQNIINNSKKFYLNNKIIVNNNNLVICNMYEYNEMCAYINLGYAKVIDMLIPINEVVLNIVSIQEKITNNEYMMVLTDKRIIIMDDKMYTCYNYSDVVSFSLISKSLMTQLVYFNDIVILVKVNYNDLLIIYNIVTNDNYRNNLVKEKTKYLCGIVPVYQNINKIKSGISIDNNNQIVFHNKKENNYLCKYDDILNYELMEDNTVVRKKIAREKSQSMGFSKKECYKMTLRVTLTNNNVFELIILEPTTFNNSYYHTDKTYLEFFNFAKEIMDKLDSFNKDIF